MIQFKNVTKCYQDTPILRDISFHVAQGETLAVLGASGAGKSSILYLLTRLTEPDQGDIVFNQQSILSSDPIGLRQNFGCVFQGLSLFPHLSIAENLTLVLQDKKMHDPAALVIAASWLKRMGLDPERYMHQYPAQLSGGQIQRVELARALMRDPLCLLLDEPFSAVDSIVRQELQKLIVHLKTELHKTIIFVTHDVAEAFLLGDRIAIIEHGQLVQWDTGAQIRAHPASAYIARICENVNGISG